MPAMGANLYIGLSWEFNMGQKVDLDATLVLIDGMGNTVDAVYYNKLHSDTGAIVHSGDSRDGRAEGYDEKISINGANVNYAV